MLLASRSKMLVGRAACWSPKWAIDAHASGQDAAKCHRCREFLIKFLLSLLAADAEKEALAAAHPAVSSSDGVSRQLRGPAVVRPAHPSMASASKAAFGSGSPISRAQSPAPVPRSRAQSPAPPRNLGMQERSPAPARQLQSQRSLKGLKGALAAQQRRRQEAAVEAIAAK